MKCTSYQYTYFTLTVVEITKQKRAGIVTLVLWPAKWRVTEMKTQTERQSMRQCAAWSGLLHRNRWVWSNGKIMISRGKSKIRAEKPAEVSVVRHWCHMKQCVFEAWWHTRRNQISSFAETDESI